MTKMRNQSLWELERGGASVVYIILNNLFPCASLFQGYLARYTPPDAFISFCAIRLEILLLGFTTLPKPILILV